MEAAMAQEIERKFLIKDIPFDLSQYPYHEIKQGYLTRNPVVRIRKQDQEYYLTYKGKGKLSREEYNLPLTEEAYNELEPKISGNLIVKRRYVIPIENNLKVELDFFEGIHKGLVLAEVEFPTEEDANSFVPLNWFGEDVTFSTKYHNSNLSLEVKIRELL